MVRWTLFCDILDSGGHFLVIFWCLGGLSTCLVSWGGLGGPGSRCWFHDPLQGSSFGVISAPFFEKNHDRFHVVF